MGIIKLKNVNEEQQENVQPEGVQVFEAGVEIPVSEEKPQEEQDSGTIPPCCTKMRRERTKIPVIIF